MICDHDLVIVYRSSGKIISNTAWRFFVDHPEARTKCRVICRHCSRLINVNP
jgi:hypothetical protein